MRVTKSLENANMLSRGVERKRDMGRTCVENSKYRSDSPSAFELVRLHLIALLAIPLTTIVRFAYLLLLLLQAKLGIERITSYGDVI